MYESERLKIGQNIARYRKKKKLSQKELAIKSGITTNPENNSTICRIETGKLNTTLNTLLMISETLKVPLHRLLKY